jgi:hypothetical protein
MALYGDFSRPPRRSLGSEGAGLSLDFDPLLLAAVKPGGICLLRGFSGIKKAALSY